MNEELMLGANRLGNVTSYSSDKLLELTSKPRLMCISECSLWNTFDGYI